MEPVYQYVRGQGWVPGLACNSIVKQHDGKQYRVSARAITRPGLTRAVLLDTSFESLSPERINAILEQQTWWEEWGECAAGFSSVKSVSTRLENHMEIVTEEI